MIQWIPNRRFITHLIKEVLQRTWGAKKGLTRISHKAPTAAAKTLFPQGLALMAYLTVYLTVYSAQSQQFIGPLAQGVGGAGRGDRGLAESAFLNPASLAHSPPMSTGFYYRDGGPSREQQESLWGLTLSDNHKGVAFTGALSYLRTQRSFAKHPDVSEDLWQVSGGNFIYRQLAFGASFYRISQREHKARTYTQWNSTMGLHWNPRSHFAMGLVYHHLMPQEEEIPLHLKLQPAWAVGFTYLASKFVRFKLDVTYPQMENPRDRLTYHGGMENVISRYATFRWGAEFDPIHRRNSYSFGLTLNLMRWHLDYAFKKYDEGKNGSTLHSIDFRVPI